MPEARSNLIDEIKQVIDITSRVDERMKIIAESQIQLDQRLNHFIDEHNALTSRVQVMVAKAPDAAMIDEKHHRILAKLDMIESLSSPKMQGFIEETEDDVSELKARIKELESHTQGSSEKIKQILGYVWQGLFIVLVAWLLFKMGLNPPPGE